VEDIEIFGCKWWLVSYIWNLNILGSEVVKAGALVPRIWRKLLPAIPE
jgi:hypothetical protein